MARGLGAPAGTPDGQRTVAWLHQHVHPHGEQQMHLRAAEVSREKGGSRLVATRERGRPGQFWCQSWPKEAPHTPTCHLGVTSTQGSCPRAR